MSTHRTHWKTPTRALSAILIAGQLLIGLPAVEAATPQAPPPAKQERLAEPPPVNVNRTVPRVTPPPATPRFSANPSDLEISEARVFEEPILRVGGEHQDSENLALATALTAYLSSGGGERTAPIQEFLAAHPGTGWRASLLLNLGLVYRRTGYFSRALNAWEEVWLLAKDASDPAGRAVADRGVGELAELNARLGRYDRLDTLFAEIEGRDVRGSAAERVSAARQGRALMESRPEDSFRCGPMALDRILAYGRADYRRDDRLTHSKSTLKGMSLMQVRNLARELGLDMQMAFRPPSAEPVFPAVIHWKAGHFAALIGRDGDRYLIQDPTFGNDMWVTRAALDEEGTGYLIVRAGALPAGWRAVADAEGDGVWGKGTTEGPDPTATGPPEHVAPCGGSNPNMAGYSVNTMTVNLMVSDTPVTYSSPRGPSIDFTVWHNQRDAYQPQVFSYSNLGPKWTFDWLSYLEDDPAIPAADVNLYRRGSGRETSSGFNSGTQEYAPHYKSRAVVVRTSISPIQYERRLPDGSKELFGQPDGASVFPRKVFMTAWEDPAGNRVSLTFDASLRIVAATDAIGQVTTLSYDLPTDTRKITKVTDPFGRFATFDYGVDGRLQRITDRIGITSEFTYAGQDRIDSLTTPYGTTKFAFGDAGRDRWVEITDPLGGRERIEYRDRAQIPGTEPVPTGFYYYTQYLDYRNTFYWDKRAMVLAPGDYTKAQIFHWLHGGPNFNLTAGTLESEKKPLEGRVWYAYPNQPNSGAIGSMATPIKVGRILDDGATQLYQYEYNALGKVTRKTDPVGRETVYEYDTNEMDLLRVKQKNGSNYDLLESRTYNTQHRPLTLTDAAGQTTTYTYDPQGRRLTIVTPPRNGLTLAERTSTNEYYPDDATVGAGRLKKLTGPTAAGGAPITTMEYDAYGRAWKVAGALGDVIATEYDVLDRVIKRTYPDGTYEELVYNRLDPEKRRDRSGRWAHYLYDAMRRTVATRDALGRTTTQHWCICGSLDKLVDANGNALSWERDLQARVAREIRADGTFKVYVYENTTSRLKQVTDVKQQVRAYEYFLDDQVKQITYSNAQIPTVNASFTYDPVDGRWLTMTDGTGTTTFTYHPVGVLGAGRRASVDSPLADDMITYEYDELGRLKTRKVNGTANTVGQTHDAVGRLNSMTTPLGTFAYSYLGATGRTSSIAYPNGQLTTYTYYDVTGDRRRAEIHNELPGGATLSKFGYSYDPVGNLTSWSTQLDAQPSASLALGYDAAEELVTANRTPADPVLPDRFFYAYDNGGNRVVEQRDDASMATTYNSLNELVSGQPGGALLFRGTVNEPSTVTVAGKPAEVGADNRFSGSAPVTPGTNTTTVTASDPSGNLRTNVYQVDVLGITRTFSYDANGNLISDGTRTFEWDADDRLVAINESTTLRTEFTYDHLRRCVRIIEKSNGAVTSTKLLVWSQTEILEERDGANNVTKRFYPLGAQVGSLSLFYAKDHLRSVREVVDGAGVVRARYDYDPWGRVTKLAGDLDCDFRYTGHYFHAPSGLSLALHRAYDPNLGRWLSRDPLKDAELRQGPNFYEYSFNNPINRLDPLGLDSPRCDGVPDKLETDCVLECCAQHDKCYKDNVCTSQSWFCPPYYPCQGCNIAAVFCVTVGCFFVTANHPERPDCFDAATGQFGPCPPPNIKPQPPRTPNPPSCWTDPKTGRTYCWTGI